MYGQNFKQTFSFSLIALTIMGSPVIAGTPGEDCMNKCSQQNCNQDRMLAHSCENWCRKGGNPSLADYCGKAARGGMGGMPQPSHGMGGMGGMPQPSHGMGGMGGMPQPSHGMGGMGGMPQPSHGMGGMGGMPQPSHGMGQPPHGMGGMDDKNKPSPGPSMDGGGMGQPPHGKGEHKEKEQKEKKQESSPFAEKNLEGSGAIVKVVAEDRGGLLVEVIQPAQKETNLKIGDKVYVHSDKLAQNSLTDVKKGEILKIDTATTKAIFEFEGIRRKVVTSTIARLKTAQGEEEPTEGEQVRAGELIQELKLEKRSKHEQDPTHQEMRNYIVEKTRTDKTPITSEQAEKILEFMGL